MQARARTCRNIRPPFVMSESGECAMAEVEIHAGHGHEIDAFGRSVGCLVGMIGIVLALSDHRRAPGALGGDHHAHRGQRQMGLLPGEKGTCAPAGRRRRRLPRRSAAIRRAPHRVIAKFRADAQRYLHESDALNQEARALEAECQAPGRARLAARSERGVPRTRPGAVLAVLPAKRRFFPLLGASAGGRRCRPFALGLPY